MSNLGEWTNEQDRAPADDSNTGHEEEPNATTPAASKESPPAGEGGNPPDPADDDGTPPGDDDDDGTDDDGGDDDDSQRSRLNGEAAKYRKQRNAERKRADDYGARLFRALVAQSGRLTDPSDMPVDMDLLDDPDALNDAIDELVERKPHLRAKTFGNIGAHGGSTREPVSLGSILRSHA